jgi:hypothetical protein
MRIVGKTAAVLILSAGLAFSVSSVAEAQTGTVPSQCGGTQGKVEKSGSKVRGVGYAECNDPSFGVYVKVTLYEVRDGKTRKVATDTCTAGPVDGCTARTKYASKTGDARYYATTFFEAN